MVYNKKYGMEESELCKYRKCIACKELVLRINAIMKAETPGGDKHPYCIRCHKEGRTIIQTITKVHK